MSAVSHMVSPVPTRRMRWLLSEALESESSFHGSRMRRVDPMRLWSAAGTRVGPWPRASVMCEAANERPVWVRTERP